MDNMVPVLATDAPRDDAGCARALRASTEASSSREAVMAIKPEPCPQSRQVAQIIYAAVARQEGSPGEALLRLVANGMSCFMTLWCSPDAFEVLLQRGSCRSGRCGSGASPGRRCGARCDVDVREPTSPSAGRLIARPWAGHQSQGQHGGEDTRRKGLGTRALRGSGTYHASTSLLHCFVGAHDISPHPFRCPGPGPHGGRVREGRDALHRGRGRRDPHAARHLSS